MSNLNNELSDIPSVPSLDTLSSPSVLKTYRSMYGGAALLFRRLYKAIWYHLWPIGELSPMAQAYGIIHIKLSPSLTVTQWLTFCRLWILSRGGLDTIDGRRLSFRNVEYKHLAVLRDAGLIKRHRFDPANPRLSSHRSPSYAFITITPAGLKFYRESLIAVNRAVLLDTMNYQPLSKQKG